MKVTLLVEETLHHVAPDRELHQDLLYRFAIAYALKARAFAQEHGLEINDRIMSPVMENWACALSGKES